MAISFTRHGDQRTNHRGFPKSDIELIRRCGTLIEDRENEVCLLLDKDIDREIRARKKELRKMKYCQKAHKQEIQKLERLRHCTVVFAGNNLITVHHTSRSYEKRLLRRAG